MRHDRFSTNERSQVVARLLTEALNGVSNPFEIFRVEIGRTVSRRPADDSIDTIIVIAKSAQLLMERGMTIYIA
jgi:hypothetical protein